MTLFKIGTVALWCGVLTMVTAVAVIIVIVLPAMLERSFLSVSSISLLKYCFAVIPGGMVLWFLGIVCQNLASDRKNKQSAK